MTPFVPPELLRIILTNLSSPSDLARSCSTSKTFLSIAQPLLYKDIELRIFVNGHGPPRYLRTFNEPWSQTLLELLKCNAHLKNLVQKVTIHRPLGGGRAGHDCRVPDEVPFRALVEDVIRTFPRAKLIAFDPLPLSERYEVDEVVASAQEQERLGKHDDRVALVTAFSMEVEGTLKTTSSFQGAYERFRWDPLSWYDETLEVDKLLHRSRLTLKSLDILLQETTSLAHFQNLERLSLRLVFHIPQVAIRNLTCAIASSPSLRSLQLYGSPREEDLELLLLGLLAKSLPPSLTHLCLAFTLTSDDLLPFLQDLPATSNLKRLNCPWLTLGETEEMEEVVEKFSKRGIRLTFNEKWEI